MWKLVSLAAALALTPSAAVRADAPPTRATLKVTSPAVDAQQRLAPEHTCDGARTPPPIAWSGAPPRTRSLAIVVEDRDAAQGPFTHWLVTNIPATATALDEATLAKQGAIAGDNGAGRLGYVAPCPPSGLHHYAFRVFALDEKLPARPFTRAELFRELSGHLVAQGELVATYEKAGSSAPRSSTR